MAGKLHQRMPFQTQRMKVLMFGWEFPPYNSGGLGVACWGLTRALTRLGVEVTFVLPKTLPLAESHCKILFADRGARLKVRSLDTLLTPYITSGEYITVRGRRFGIYSANLFDEVLRYASLASALALEEDFDVIHAHDWLSFLAGIEAKRVSGKPLVIHVHATEFDRTGNGSINQFVYDIEREGMAAADRIVAVSAYTKNILVERYGVAESKIKVVHNGIDEEDYVGEIGVPEFVQILKREGNKIVLFVGRITLQKGPDYFVELARRVLTHMPNVYFIVSGSGDMEGQIIKSVAHSGISDHFIFAGFLRGDELAAAYRSADLFIMPSVSEPFGITPLEAAMHSTPVLISKQSGVSEVLSHALRTDFWDIDEMTNKVISVLSHDSLKDTLRSNSHAEVLGINWKIAAQKCIMLWRELTGLK